MKQDNAFTGLEAAIVLIAFVVVAAVFSYVLLGAGFFATQKAQEATYAAIQGVTSNMIVVGQIYGNVTGGADKTLAVLNIRLGVREAAQPQDVSEIQLLFSNGTSLPTLLTYHEAANIGTCTSNCWYIDPAQNPKLYSGDKVDLTVHLHTDHNVGSGSTHSRTFNLEIKPRIGASLLIDKTLFTGFTHGPLY